MKTRIAIAALIVIFIIAVLLLVRTRAMALLPTYPEPLVLNGTIVTADRVIQDGYVLIEGERIADVSETMPSISNAQVIETEGVIYAGLIDVHNHVSWNVLPRWQPPQLYQNRYEWRSADEYQTLISEPYNDLISTSFCDMNTYGEMRALIGGTTSILMTAAQSCVHGLVRNLDSDSGFYTLTPLNQEHVSSEIGLPLPDDPNARTRFVRDQTSRMNSPTTEALFIHLAEGVDDSSLEEFTFFGDQGLLTSKAALIHAIPLAAADFERMADAGAALIWSPRSNIELYGQTADIGAALDAGVEIALAPDWAITGSSNMLDELRYADQWNQAELGSRLTDEQLVRMVTLNPARIAGIDDEVGDIKAGLFADLLVISGDRSEPYRALIEADASNVRLVLINGLPLYGSPELMSLLWDDDQLQSIPIGGGDQSLASPAVSFQFAEIAANLTNALSPYQITLAPLTDD